MYPHRRELPPTVNHAVNRNRNHPSQVTGASRPGMLVEFLACEVQGPGYAARLAHGCFTHAVAHAWCLAILAPMEIFEVELAHPMVSSDEMKQVWPEQFLPIAD